MTGYVGGPLVVDASAPNGQYIVRLVKQFRNGEALGPPLIRKGEESWPRLGILLVKRRESEVAVTPVPSTISRVKYGSVALS